MNKTGEKQFKEAIKIIRTKAHDLEYDVTMYSNSFTTNELLALQTNIVKTLDVITRKLVIRTIRK